jgi:hypothetical protein
MRKRTTEERLAEIERRYDQQKPERTLRLNAIAVKRVAVLERYFELRYGRSLPDDDAGREDLVILLNHIAQNPIDPQGKMRRAIHTWAWWMDHDERQELVERIAAKPRWYTASKLGKLLRLTEAEHALIGAETVWPFDATAEDMNAKSKQNDREYQKTRRRSAGAVSREEYEANSKSRTEPWKALNMSRPTYYRKLKAGEIPSETSPSPYKKKNLIERHTCLTPDPSHPISERRAPKARRRRAPIIGDRIDDEELARFAVAARATKRPNPESRRPR